jgi:large subunit ribosomal protein L19e
MQLKTQKRIAALLTKRSKKKIVFDPDKIEEIKKTITKFDIKSLMKRGLIKVLPKRGISRGRARKKAQQKRKGRQRGYGSRKGKKTARFHKKRKWINRVRIQRILLKYLRDKDMIERKTYRNLYSKVSGGFFRSRRHLNLYIHEHNLLKKNEKKN